MAANEEVESPSAAADGDNPGAEPTSWRFSLTQFSFTAEKHKDFSILRWYMSCQAGVKCPFCAQIGGLFSASWLRPLLSQCIAFYSILDFTFSLVINTFFFNCITTTPFLTDWNPELASNVVSYNLGMLRNLSAFSIQLHLTILKFFLGYCWLFGHHFFLP